MGLQVLGVLVGHAAAIQGLDLVLHDVAVLLDVVLLIELIPQRYDVLVGDVGVGVELGTGGRVGGLDIVFDEVALLPEVHAAVEGLYVLQGRLLVDGHEGFHHLPADFLAGHLVVDEQVVYDGDHNIFRDGLSCMNKGESDAGHQFFTIELFVGAGSFTNFHLVST